MRWSSPSATRSGSRRPRRRSHRSPIPTQAARPASDTTRPPVRSSARSGNALHGRVGVRYLTIRQAGGGPSYSQPSLDLRLDGSNIGGSAFGLNADIRARRTSSTLADGATSQDHSYRVYGLALSFRPMGSPFRLTVGRQFSAPLASVSFFDGLTAEYTRPTWGIGAFGGTQPDPTSFGYATDLKEFGAYFQFRSRPGSQQRWSLTTGGIGSYQNGHPNREFLFLNGTWSSSRVSAYISQEVDYNHGWKASVGEPTLSPTSTYASLVLPGGVGRDLPGRFR